MSTRAIVWAAGLCSLSLVVVGCRSTGEPSRTAPIVPAAQAAFSAPRNTEVDAPARTPRDQQQPNSKVSENERRSVGKASRVVPLALALVGAPYRWGGADPRGFDCSGFVMYVYGRAGVSLPHGAVKQYRLGTPVARKELAPGDIVFFDRLNHSGIYIGDGRFVHASKTGDAVKVSRLDEAWFERRWVGARRLPIADRQSRSDD